MRHAILFGILLVFAVVRCWCQLYGTRYTTHDGFMVLDGAWRMLHGQHPHVDFNSMIGPVAYWPFELGLWLTRSAGWAFGLAQSGVGLLLATWAYVLCRRMSWVPRAALALCIFAVAASPAQIGVAPTLITPGMSYNRFAYALFGVLLLESFAQRGRSNFFDGVSAGVSFVLLAFLKITFAVLAAPLLALFFVLCPQTRQRAIGIAAGALAAALLCFRAIAFSPGAVVRDLAITAGAKHPHLRDFYSYDSILLEAGLTMALTFGVAVWFRAAGKQKEFRRLAVGGGAILLASVLLIFGNWQPSELPVAAFLSLLLVDALRHAEGDGLAPGKELQTIVGGAAIAFTCVTVGSFGAAVATQAWVKLHTAVQEEHFTAGSLSGFVPVSGDVGYTRFVNSGTELLVQNRRAGERVMSLDFANPFSLALQIPPAPGGTTNLQFGGSFDVTHRLSGQQLFGRAELVMLPLSFSDSTLTESIPLIYGPYLHENYDLVARSDLWELYRRR